MAQAKNEPRKQNGKDGKAETWPKSEDPFLVADDEELKNPPRSTEADIKKNDRPKIPRDN